VVIQSTPGEGAQVDLFVPLAEITAMGAGTKAKE
jgi:hypothetical protein